ncbi:MAG TPA: hypothetical protein PKA62_15310 [Thermoanaerobaculia bacterium]|nr:hypothetical protein [Thermoanaerobaculia bacterium]
MPDTKKLLDVVTSAKPGVLFGRVSALLDDAVLVSCGEGSELVACDLLDPEAGRPGALAEGERVLVVVPEGGGGRGVVLGRVAFAAALAARPKETPEEIVLEAKKGLTLRVGEGSVTLREDGKVLIRGKDLVSHARRLNRIRGGSVSIN